MWRIECDQPRKTMFTYDSGQRIVRYKLDFVGVEEVRWDKEGALRVKGYKFFYGREIKIIN
jgi:hypothetical protein